MQTNLAMQPKYLPKQTHKSASRPLRRPQVPPTLQARARFEQTNFCRQGLSYCRQGLSTVDKVCHLVDVADELMLHRGYAEAVQGLCRGCIVAAQWLHSGCAVAVQRLCRGCAEALHRLCRGCTVSVQRLCRGCAEAADKNA